MMSARHKTFQGILADLQPTNVARIRSRAVIANALAKRVESRSRANAYTVKSRAIARLVELGAGRLSEIKLLGSSALIGVSFFPSGGGLHVPFGELSFTAKSLVIAQAGTVFGRELSKGVSE